MKKIACLSAVALLALVGCQSEKKDSNMSVMSEKSGACCSEKDAKTCTDKSADKGNMSVMSEKKSCSEGKSCSDSAKTCPVTGQSGNKS
ncbi:MAG TPA: hypothetical protein VK176_13490 [Phycisphaerales bacterium]|nr:hypothetical protein [Phycisphaerales bacterium]